MATNFPTSLDAFTNPTSTDAMDSGTVPHASQHANLNDAVEALQAKVGVNGSAVTSSLDYKVEKTMGLVLVKTQTVGTAVSSVTVSDAFSSTFENYRIIFSGGTQSNSTTMDIRLGSSTTGYYGFLTYGDSSAGTVLGANSNNATSFSFVGGAIGNQRTHLSCDVIGPNIAAYTKILNGTYQNSGAYGTMQGEHRVATAYTAFTILPANGTLTGGTIRVYGYNNG